MQIETKKNGGKLFRFDEPSPQVGGGYEDTMMMPCNTRGCENSFEQSYPEPGETMAVFCPDCRDAYNDQSY